MTLSGFTAASRQIAGKPAPTPSAEADCGAVEALILTVGVGLPTIHCAAMANPVHAVERWHRGWLT
jgi:hypothetical protein